MTNRVWQLGLRRSEWLCLVFFCYVVCLSPFFPDRPLLGWQPIFITLWVFTILLLVRQCERGKWALAVNRTRDWLLPAVTLTAFQEMELFRPRHFPYFYEPVWIKQDLSLLQTWHLQGLLESLGPVIPFYLEFCYLLVYGFPFYCIGILYVRDLRRFVDVFFIIYLAGTLATYAMFPFFPSQPPRLLYPGTALPHFTSWLRNLNVFILTRGSIHASVFPSAHVSSAFSAAWAMFFIQPKRKIFGWILTLYAVSVSLATIYGRYHYTADVLAGMGVSVITSFICMLVMQRSRKTSE